MNGISNVGARIASLGLDRFIPEPKSRAAAAFRSLMSTVAGVVGGGSTNTVDISPEYQALLELQIKVQQELQQVSMQSNIEKSRHETEMAAIRNIRAG